jgi:transposase-like protein
MKQRRVKRSEATWLELFSRQASSGLTVAQFCDREGINAGLFRRWRLALKEPKPRAEGVSKVKAASALAAPFIDLGGLRSGGSRFEVRLELGGGMVLSLTRS